MPDSRCPTCGSLSTDAEFCSECGAAMAKAVPAAAPGAGQDAQLQNAQPAAGEDRCPVCGEARPGPFARYCDTCRYDFLEKHPFSAGSPSPPVAAPARAITPLPTTVPIVSSPASLAQRWDLNATVDPSLRRPDDPVPTDLRARIYPLDLADHLIGRRSDSDDIHPEITIPDPGISRRHARILRAPDGALTLLDLGSMNGTRLNGAPVEPNVATPLADGDELTLGCWTRLVPKAR